MTEHEARLILDVRISRFDHASDVNEALEVAKSALKEIEQYRQLGTLEELREAVEKQKAISREVIEGKYFCPKCHNLMPYPGYCGCGQKLY